jgi:hypothetical protein
MIIMKMICKLIICGLDIWFKREGGEGRGGEEKFLIIYMFGSKEGRGGKGRNFNYKCVWFTRGGDG